jgi:hypothetical protein
MTNSAILQAMDRLTHYQYAVAGDYWEWSLAQTTAALAAKNPVEYLARQVELGIRIGGRLQQHAAGFTRFVDENPEPTGHRSQEVSTPALATIEPVVVVSATKQTLPVNKLSDLKGRTPSTSRTSPLQVKSKGKRKPD